MSVVAAALVTCCWCAAFACRDLCLHVVCLGDPEVVLYQAIKQGSTTAMHASLMKLLLLADPKHKSELDSSCTEYPNNSRVTTILRIPTSLQLGCSLPSKTIDKTTVWNIVTHLQKKLARALLGFCRRQ
jgi:hypothetical protein